jgi:hypothetical protein
MISSTNPNDLNYALVSTTYKFQRHPKVHERQLPESFNLYTCNPKLQVLYSVVGHLQRQRPCIGKRRWQWIGHVLRMDNNMNAGTALDWAPEGKRKRGRPKETWRRTVKKKGNR